MRRGTTWLLAFGAVALAASTSMAGPSKAKLLVQDLVPQGVEPHEAAVISTAACNAIAKDGKFDVLCGEDLRNLMRFGALSASFDGCAAEDCFASMGKAMQARYVVSGSVSKLGATFVLNLSMFDTEAGRPVGRTEVKATTIEKLHDSAAEAASAILTHR